MGRPAHYQRHKRYNPTCPVCERRFTSTRSDAQYCSPACRMKVCRAVRLLDAVVKSLGAMRPNGKAKHGDAQKRH